MISIQARKLSSLSKQRDHLQNKSRDDEKPEDIEEEEEEEEEPLSPAAPVVHEHCFNVFVIAIAGCKTRINVDVVEANLGHTLLTYPRFSALQV